VNILGQEVLPELQTVVSGAILRLDVSSLAEGTYYLTAEPEQGNQLVVGNQQETRVISLPVKVVK
jgi:hypothetical protein